MSTSLVTGAARRIGRQSPWVSPADGWAVAIHCNSSRAEAEALAGEIARRTVARPGRPRLRRCRDDRRGSLARARRPHVLVNSASLFENGRNRHDDAGKLVAASRHQSPRARAPLPSLRPRNCRRARTATSSTSSISGCWRPTPKFFSYSISKSGLWIGDPNHGAGAGAAHPRQRHRPRPGAAQLAHGRGGLSTSSAA